MTKTNKIYFGRFSSYEEYYAVGSTAEEVKNLLWKMYVNNCYDKPTKDDKRVFEEEHFITEIKADNFGYNTKFGECYTFKGRKLERLRGEK